MRYLLAVFLICCSALVHAQNNNRGQIFNKDLKMLVGTWTGNMVYTDPEKNNQQFTLPTTLLISDKTDSLLLVFNYPNSDGIQVSDTSSLRIYDAEGKLRIDGALYDIGQTVRRGPTLQVIGEKRNFFDQQRVSDLQQTITFNAGSLKILKEVRYLENEFYFIRNRMTFTRK
jgi:hypothetical protein